MAVPNYDNKIVAGTATSFSSHVSQAYQIPSTSQSSSGVVQVDLFPAKVQVDLNILAVVLVSKPKSLEIVKLINGIIQRSQANYQRIVNNPTVPP